MISLPEKREIFILIKVQKNLWTAHILQFHIVSIPMNWMLYRLKTKHFNFETRNQQLLLWYLIVRWKISYHQYKQPTTVSIHLLVWIYDSPFPLPLLKFMNLSWSDSHECSGKKIALMNSFPPIVEKQGKAVDVYWIFLKKPLFNYHYNI